MSRVLWLRLGMGTIGLAVAVAVYALAAPRLLPLPVYMRLPDLTLTDQDGRPFPLARTRGEVVVLGPIFTHCPDICPLTTQKMRQVQQGLRRAGDSGHVRLISFTVDPARDRPAVLKRFAAQVGADPSNWTFLTGTEEQIRELTRALRMYSARVLVDGTPIPDGAPADSFGNGTYLVNHTDRLFLADPHGDVRAFTPGSQADVDRVLALVRRLLPAGGS